MTGRWIIGIVVLCCLAGAARADEAARWAALAARLGSTQGAEAEQVKQDLIGGGMAAYAALKEGPEATAGVRAEVRRAIRAKRDAAERAKGLIVHEWGALSYVQGLPDGKLDAREDVSDLPEFAQVWNKLGPVGAGEGGAGGGAGGVRIDIIRKPIVYFYSDKFETVTFKVALPRGLFTQWAPKATRVTPMPAEGLDERSAAAAGGATLTWRNFDLKPGAVGAALPPVPESAWWWPICRDTDATPIEVDGRLEKFLFYRGMLADAPPVVRVEGGAKRRYTLTNTAKREAVRHLAMVHVERGKAVARYVPSLKAGETLAVDMAIGDDATPAKAFAEPARQRLAEALEEEGLFPKEAAGMTKIWRKDWFERDGVRLIYFNPAGATASLLPISIEPRPEGVVRTLLISVECLRDSKENVIRELVANLGDGAYATRERAQAELILLGRQAEGALREALAVSKDEEVRTRITVILQKIDPRAKAEAAEPGQGEERPDDPF